MAQFFFQQNTGANGAGTLASPWDQAALNAAIASGAFRTGGADSLGIVSGGNPLVISAANASGTPFFTVAGNATIQLAETVLSSATTIDLTGIGPVSPNTITLQNNNGGTDFLVNFGTELKLNAVDANGLTIRGLGTVTVENLQAVAAANLSGITPETFNVSGVLTSAVTFTGQLGQAAVTLSAATPQTFTVNQAAFIGANGSVTVGDNVTLATTAGSLEDLAGDTITTTGSGAITLTNLVAGADTNLSNVSGNVTANVTANQTTGNGINFGTIQPTVASGATLTISDDSANNTENTQFNGAGAVSYTPTAGGFGNTAITFRAYSTGRNVFDSSGQVLAGTVGNEVYTGSGRDAITTSGGRDTIQSGAGADTINAGAGNNVVRGGSGADNITTTTGNDFIEGGGGNDTINAGAGNNYVADGAGADNITTAGGIDTVASGSGADTIVTGAGNDQILAGSGADQITAGAGNDSIVAGGGNDQILVSNNGDQVAADTIDAGDGTDSIRFTGAGAVTATFDFDNITGVTTLDNAGDNLGQARNVTISAITETVAQNITINTSTSTGGGSALTLTNQSARATTTFTVNSGDDTDSLQGGSGNDTISGNAGADTIDGGAGSDSITTGAGANRIYVQGSGQQTAGDTIVGSAGDAIHFTGATAVVAEFDMDNISTVVTFANEGTSLGVTRNLTFSQITETTANAVAIDLNNSTAVTNVTNNAASTTTTFNIIGGNQADSIQGSNGTDTLNGATGADTLIGGAGADRFDYSSTAELVAAGAAVDSVVGGDATDVIFLDTAAAYTVANTDNFSRFQTVESITTVDNGVGAIALALDATAFTAGIRTVNLSGDASAGQTNTIDATEAVAGQDLTLTGGADVDNITGGAGADTITGAAGTEALKGNGGADDFVFAASAAANGVDTIADFTIAQTDQFNFDAFIPANDGGVEALIATSAQTLSAATDDDIFVVNFNGVNINGKDYGGGQFADLFGAGKAFLTTDPAAAINNVIIVQGDDESHAYYLSDAGGAVIAAGDVTQVAVMNGLLVGTPVVDANIV